MWSLEISIFLRLTMRISVEVIIFATFEVFAADNEHLALPSVITGRTWVWRSIACLHNHYCVEIMQCWEKYKHLSAQIIRQTFNAWRIDYRQSNSNMLKNRKNPKSQFSLEGFAFNCSVLESPLVFCNNLHLTLSTLYKTVQLLRYRLQSFQPPPPPLTWGPRSVSHWVGM